jgi:hypothetical protein
MRPIDTANDDAFRAIVAPTASLIRELADAALAVAPTLGANPSATSRAMSEIAAEVDRYGSLSDWIHPITDTHMLGGLTLFAACDYARGFANAIEADPTPVYAHLVSLRASLEVCVVSAWLNDPGIGHMERIKRGLAEQLYNAKELRRLGIDDGAQQRVERWRATATQFGWATDVGPNKPTVDGVGRPSVPSGIDELLPGKQSRLGRVLWSYLSAVTHGTWYGLREALTPHAEAEHAGFTLASVGTSTSSIRWQAVCLLGAVRAASTVRNALMGWSSDEWVTACRRAEEHEIALVAAAQADAKP